MTPKRISRYILALAISLLMLMPGDAYGQRKKLVQEPDTTAWFQGVEVSADLVGLAMNVLGDYGQYEAAARLNLKDRYFPVVEMGIGKCDHIDDATTIHYKTRAPYWKIGADFNVLKNKHDIYRVYLGARYAFTTFNVDYDSRPVTDYYWGDISEWGESNMNCNQHWAEVLFGVQAKVWGPFHLGWSARYMRRITYKEGEFSNAWYVPGYGQRGNANLGFTFNVIIVI